MRRFLAILCCLSALPSWCGADLESRDADEVRRIKKEWRAINVEYLKLEKQLEELQARHRQLQAVAAEHDQLVARGERVRLLTTYLTARLVKKWQSQSGSELVARIKSMGENSVVLLTGEGREVRIDLDGLSAEDRVFLHNLERCNSFTGDKPATAD